MLAVPVGAHDERVTGTGPGDPWLLAARDAARLRRLYGRGRVSGDWSGFAAAAREQRAAGVSAEVVGRTVGVGGNWVLQLVRRHDPEPVVAAPAGWERTAAAAAVLGVAQGRLARFGSAGEAAGVSVTVGWHRFWRLDGLAGWWEQTRDVTAADARAARFERVRELRAQGLSAEAVAAAVGVGVRTVYRVCADRSSFDGSGSG